MSDYFLVCISGFALGIVPAFILLVVRIMSRSVGMIADT